MSNITCTECGIHIDPDTMWIVYVNGLPYCGDCGECLDKGE